MVRRYPSAGLPEGKSLCVETLATTRRLRDPAEECLYLGPDRLYTVNSAKLSGTFPIANERLYGRPETYNSLFRPTGLRMEHGESRL